MPQPSVPTPRRLQAPLRWTLTLAAVSLLGCAGKTPTAQRPSTDERELTAQVSKLRSAAALHEGTVTPLLQRVAKAHGGSLYGLEHRKKTTRSITRKLRLIRSKKRPTPAFANIVLNDTLRYTMVVADQPPGRYVNAIRVTLAELARQGHEPLVLKNYWPPGDNYSGVNCVLTTREGFHWELQFHTPSSLRTQKATRAQYEELRRRATPRPRKQALFDAMAGLWERVPLPRRILEPGALHRRARIIRLPRP